MAEERIGHSVGVRAGRAVGLVFGEIGIRGPDSLSGCLCHVADPAGAAAVGPEEMGLLDSVAGGECHADNFAHKGRACLYAYSVRIVFDKWNLVFIQLGKDL